MLNSFIHGAFRSTPEYHHNNAHFRLFVMETSADVKVNRSCDLLDLWSIRAREFPAFSALPSKQHISQRYPPTQRQRELLC